jgi:hypothetical protein
MCFMFTVDSGGRIRLAAATEDSVAVVIGTSVDGPQKTASAWRTEASRRRRGIAQEFEEYARFVQRPSDVCWPGPPSR